MMNPLSNEKHPELGLADVSVAVDSSDDGADENGKRPVPLKMKILSVVVVSMIGFGGHWSSGVTGALKSTLKKASVAMASEADPLARVLTTIAAAGAQDQ